ncbi:hypothetical protein [Methylosinus sp. Sm6]|uniref:hypothetical protein n=1 Tax=Methylosinus sp. Sm6 TaxID=2866948 RepID=UPI001C997AC8|nr:hypothetical protein [Methylosinus sp. Sm6]MBY6243978.1 hypothetical protein [Methylosinus sp. Sm6]
MRLVSIGRLIVALALAAQALIALQGGAFLGVAAARDGASPICDLQRRHFERRLPDAPRDTDAAACASCQACLGGYSPIPTHQASHFADLGDASVVVWPRFAQASLRSAIARSHRARAPPLPA